MVVHQTEKLLRNDRNTNKTKRQPVNWERIFANDTSKGPISKINKELIQLNNNNKTI